jgi:hypothetical protein
LGVLIISFPLWRTSEEESDDEDDDELELQRELEQIRRDREAAARRRDEEERAAAEKVQLEAAVRGNPLLAAGGDGASAKVFRSAVLLHSRC